MVMMMVIMMAVLMAISIGDGDLMVLVKMIMVTVLC